MKSVFCSLFLHVIFYNKKIKKDKWKIFLNSRLWFFNCWHVLSNIFCIPCLLFINKLLLNFKIPIIFKSFYGGSSRLLSMGLRSFEYLLKYNACFVLYKCQNSDVGLIYIRKKNKRNETQNCEHLPTMSRASITMGVSSKWNLAVGTWLRTTGTENNLKRWNRVESESSEPINEQLLKCERLVAFSTSYKSRFVAIVHSCKSQMQVGLNSSRVNSEETHQNRRGWKTIILEIWKHPKRVVAVQQSSRQICCQQIGKC